MKSIITQKSVHVQQHPRPTRERKRGDHARTCLPALSALATLQERLQLAVLVEERLVREEHDVFDVYTRERNTMSEFS